MKLIVAAAVVALAFTTGFTCSKNTPAEQAAAPATTEQAAPAAATEQTAPAAEGQTAPVEGQTAPATETK